MKYTRRDILKAAVAVPLGIVPLVAATSFENESKTELSAVSGPGRVVKVHMPNMRMGSFPRSDAARLMVDKALMTLARETDPGRAWSKFVSTSDRIGIKINCLGTKMVSTMKEVTFAVADSLREFGVPDKNILVFDMFGSNMAGGRYNLQADPSKMRILAHRDHGYQKSWTTAGPAKVKFSDLFLWTTAIINIPPIKDHDLAGVTCTMKNMSFGVVEKPHVNHNAINESIAHIYALEEVRKRVRINIVDGSTILYDGGPKYNPAALVSHECVYATEDPVAMDSIAYELIEVERAKNKLKTLADVNRPPKFLEMSATMGLGESRSEFISLETVELPPYRELSS